MNPTLRFATSDSIDWNLVSIKDLVYPIKSGKSKKNDNGDYVLYGATGIIGHTNDVYNEDSLILAARVGSVGNVSLVYGKFGVSDNVLVVKPNEKSDIGYVYHLLANKVNWKSLSNGTSQLVVSAKKVEDYKIYVANFEEQQKIASFFSTLDEMISISEKKLLTFRHLKLALLRKVFTQAIRFKNQDGKEYPSWNKDLLKNVISVSGGHTPSMANPDYWDSKDIVWVTSKDMKSDYIDTSELYISNSASKTLRKYQPGTILLVARSGILKHSLPLSLLKCEATINQDLKALEAKGINGEFLFFYLKSLERYILRNFVKTGTTVQSLMLEELYKISISIPCAEEQKKIAAFFSTLDELINAQQKIVSQLKLTKKGFIQQMFT